MPQLKKCRGCRKTLNPNDFHNDKAKHDGKSNYCKDCKRERWRRFSRDNPNSNYRLVRGQIAELRDRFGNYCQGCGKEGTKELVLVVDHCHVSGAVRGLLCRGCNSALGMAADNPATLRKLSQYIEDFNFAAELRNNKKEEDSTSDEEQERPTSKV